jgi:hypothetical protein
MIPRILVLAAVAASLGGCMGAGQKVLVRNLPPAPAYAQPVLVADPRVGDDALVVAARERLGRVQANCVITHFRDWYARVRQAYAEGGDQSPMVAEVEAVCGKLNNKKKR